ncbi:2-acylglycerol O-acyltransferase 2-A-like [Paramacrobiotus metropolitanus]|uniref:2-acylglycerol O-acyltransferase 2-A-like n=1 Tax=Paramacrobiotus metropolitanus TaxID=2943436 RepID=UPI0024464735|nr:2-acylglycerol O-acyltransferase 2-A-like [Paramacrobiotus metropolitanus]
MSGKKVGGIEWAPLNIPLQRRLQTLAAFMAVMTFFFGGVSGLFFLAYLLHTKYYWITFLYAVWLLYDYETCSRGGRRFEWVRRWKLHTYLRDFFPISLVKTAELDPGQNYIVGYHPHGVMGAGTTNFTNEANNVSHVFPGVKFTVLTLKLLHFLPFYREFISACGLCDVSKESINYIFRKKGNAIVILIGGAKESMDANPRKTTLVLKGRKGFAKMALKHGAHLVPAFSFGENDIFRLLVKNDPGSRVRKLQRYVQKVAGYAPIMVSGRGIFNYTFGFVPYRHPITTVVGKPIVVEKDEDPSLEKITALHETYMAELEKLFNTHKDKYGYGDQSLEFIE